MIAVHFSKDLAALFLHAVKTGQPIPPPPGGWTQDHMLMLAGMLVAAIHSLGPQTHQRVSAHSGNLDKPTLERHESSESSGQTWRAEIGLGAEFLSKLADHVVKGDYDKKFESTVEALVYEEADGDKKFQPVKGFKTLPNLS
jgi:hypothetical protein